MKDEYEQLKEEFNEMQKSLIEESRQKEDATPTEKELLDFSVKLEKEFFRSDSMVKAIGNIPSSS